MIGVSDRRTDAFDNPWKATQRLRHLDVLRKVPELWQDGQMPRLRGSWLELMGATGWRTLELLTDHGAILPEQFVGVDLDAQRIEDYRHRYPGARWLGGNVLDLVCRPELRDTSVVNYDAYEEVASPRLAHLVEQFAPVLRRSLDLFGAAALLWNADLDSPRLRRRSPLDALRTHAGVIAGLLERVAGERRTLDVSRLLPTAQACAVREATFTGVIGAFEVYRGKPGGHRMACLRVVLR